MNAPVRKVVIVGGGTADTPFSSPADLIGASMRRGAEMVGWMRRSGRRMTMGKGG